LTVVVDLTSRPTPTPFSERVGLLTVHIMENVNIGLFRLSNGRVGGSIWGSPVILLTTSGRVTGIRRTKPLLALPDASSWIVAGSRGGTRHHPDWYQNLVAYASRAAAGTLTDDPALVAPEVEVEGGHRFTVSIEVLDAKDRAHWWHRLVSVYPRFASYQERSPQREIPVVRLIPAPH
jgi:hypothetical protein